MNKYYYALLICLAVPLMAFFPKETQNQSDDFCVFIIHEIDDIQDCRQVDSLLRATQGMQMSRTDLNTKRVYCIYDPGNPRDKAWFEQQLNPLGYTISCFSSGVRGVDPFPAITHEQCNQ